MKYRMHKRVETKPDGRKIYYYTFEPAETQEHETPAEPDPRAAAQKGEATHAPLAKVQYWSSSQSSQK